MNLKTACKIALIVTVVSIPLTLLGYALLYFPILTKHFHYSNLINAVIGQLTVLMQAGGFALFMLAVLPRLKDPAANTGGLVVLAGILVLLGTLISTAQCSMHSAQLYKHLPLLKSLLYITLYGAAFLSGLCLSIFILAQIGGTCSSKALAVTTLVFTLILCGLIIARQVIYFGFFGILSFLGLMAMLSGSMTRLLATALFLFAWIKQKALPTE